MDRIVEVVLNRIIHSDERHCKNCHMYTSCWNTTNYGDVEELKQSLPVNFTNRQHGWGGMRLLIHMQAVYGQICGNFRSRQAIENEEAEKYKFKAKREGWDY